MRQEPCTGIHNRHRYRSGPWRLRRTAQSRPRASRPRGRDEGDFLRALARNPVPARQMGPLLPPTPSALSPGPRGRIVGTAMALSHGTRLAGPTRSSRQSAGGGMGEVCCARDTRPHWEISGLSKSLRRGEESVAHSGSESGRRNHRSHLRHFLPYPDRPDRQRRPRDRAEGGFGSPIVGGHGNLYEGTRALAWQPTGVQ